MSQEQATKNLKNMKERQPNKIETAEFKEMAELLPICKVHKSEIYDVGGKYVCGAGGEPIEYEWQIQYIYTPTNRPQ